MIWAKIKAAINSTLGTKEFKPLDKIIEDGFGEVKELQNEIKNMAETTEANLKSGNNDYSVANSIQTSKFTFKLLAKKNFPSAGDDYFDGFTYYLKEEERENLRGLYLIILEDATLLLYADPSMLSYSGSSCISSYSQYGYVSMIRDYTPISENPATNIVIRREPNAEYPTKKMLYIYKIDIETDE